MGLLPLVHKKERPRRCFTWRNHEQSTDAPERHAFYEEFRVYWIFLKAIGFLPYHVDRKGIIRFQLFSKEMLFSVIVYSLLSIPVCLSMRLRCREKFLAGDDFDRMIFTYMMAGLMIPHFTIPFTHWKYYKNHETVFKLWHQFQKHYEELLKTKLVLHNQCWKCYYFLMLLFAGTCIVFFSNFFLVQTHYWWEFCAHIYVQGFFLIHLLVYIEQCASVVALGRDLRTRTIEAANARNATLIADYCSIWVHLSEVGGLIGYLFYRMYGHLLITIFTISTVALYVFLRMKELRLSLMLWHPVAAIAICKAWIYLFCECGERISTELGQKFTLRLLKLRHQIKDEDTRYEVDCFLSAMKTLPPVISLNNYVTVNRKLFITIYSTMATYLIVVLQFSQEFHPDRSSRNTAADDESFLESSSFFISHLGQG